MALDYSAKGHSTTFARTKASRQGPRLAGKGESERRRRPPQQCWARQPGNRVPGARRRRGYTTRPEHERPPPSTGGSAQTPAARRAPAVRGGAVRHRRSPPHPPAGRMARHQRLRRPPPWCSITRHPTAPSPGDISPRRPARPPWRRADQQVGASAAAPLAGAPPGQRPGVRGMKPTRWYRRPRARPAGRERRPGRARGIGQHDRPVAQPTARERSHCPRSDAVATQRHPSPPTRTQSPAHRQTLSARTYRATRP
jgi:hypothetical protein